MLIDEEVLRVNSSSSVKVRRLTVVVVVVAVVVVVVVAGANFLPVMTKVIFKKQLEAPSFTMISIALAFNTIHVL